MSILVTGGAGYIGSHTVKELQNTGNNVIVYDNLSNGHKQSVKNATLVIGDIHDSELLNNTIKKYNINSIIHFAANIEVAESMKNPQKYYINNVNGTLNLLKIMIQNNIKNIVFSSTAAVYGEPESIPITENQTKNPKNVYGRTKFIVEQVLNDYSQSYNFNYVALRYFNAAGADISGEIGENHSPESHLIPIIFEVILEKREKIKIFGTDYNTKDGTCIRDYIHVTDLAQAHILSLEMLKKNNKSAVYNLGNGKGFSVKEVIDTVERITGKKIKKEETEKRPGDPAVLIASSKKIKKELNWNPIYSNIDKIIETAWNWHRNNPNGYND